MMHLQQTKRYWHTIRYLRPVQIYGRVLYRLARPRPDLSSPAAVRTVTGNWSTPARRMASVTGPNSFVFLGEPGDLQINGWDDPTQTKLWRYNLHYFDDLNAIDANQRRTWHAALLNRWISENPAGKGSGWEPYPVSLRIVNWVKFAMSGKELPNTAHHSLAVQVRWLTKRMEWHLLGNHLFANAKALLFAGLYFDGSEAKSWRERAVSILENQLTEQILPDGGQFELSPMYHAIALEDVLDLVNLMKAHPDPLSPREVRLSEALSVRVPSMLRWLQVMSHPDGRISFFNDAAFGVAPENAELQNYAENLGFRIDNIDKSLVHLADSGFAKMSRGPAVIICDVGHIGPDHLPGHAHADTLSFEMSLGSDRVLVNSGTSEYGVGPERSRQRGTAAHNTVTFANQDSSEVWSGFRVARRAKVDAVEVAENAHALSVSARHDGYTRMPGGPLHSRAWTLTDTSLQIIDRLAPSSQGEARFHLPPGVTAEITGAGTGTLRLASGKVLRLRASGANPHIEAATWHPYFGQSLPCQCLILTFTGNLTLQLEWN